MFRGLLYLKFEFLLDNIGMAKRSQSRGLPMHTDGRLNYSKETTSIRANLGSLGKDNPPPNSYLYYYTRSGLYEFSHPF